MLCLSISNIATIAVKNVDYCRIFYDINKSETINLLENSVLDDRGYIYKLHIKNKNRSDLIKP